ncbi:hypothetical protein EGW08_019779 [Elysia chlorotica]|uniref:Uncharacterized protein n=1 Tax=Elysia chlorotica TaxID=188477 RepID=A0A3S0Z7H6_ELYCH|nr:hypothetical protein EGW08_019779 [Elysia chlorotica]
MGNVRSPKAIVNHLQPFLDARMEEANNKLAAVMQCLKCNRTFLKSEALKKEKKLPSSGNLQDLKALQELMAKTAFMCPKCGSSMVIDYTPSASVATATTASTSSQHGKSNPSTPVGSYSSADGWMDRAKQQKQAAKLTRGKSSDKFDVGNRFSQLVRKESSSSLLDLTRSRQSSVRSNGSITKDSHSNSVESTRERSNAFRADKMSRSTAVLELQRSHRLRQSITKDSHSNSVDSTRERSNAFRADKMSRSTAVLESKRTVSEQGELLPIEDYFEDESNGSDLSSSKLAAMTTSLRGDASTLGSKASVLRNSLGLRQSRGGNSGSYESRPRPIAIAGRSSSDLGDSGFLSGVNSQSLGRTKAGSFADMEGLEGLDRTKLARGFDSISVGGLGSSLGGGLASSSVGGLASSLGGGTASSSGNCVGSRSDAGPGSQSHNADSSRQRKTSTSSQHTHLSAMEELVNSLVKEGQESAASDSDTLGQRSVSVSTFRDLVSSSPSNNSHWRGSNSSPIEDAMISATTATTTTTTSTFHRSDSASSIAVLSSGNSIADDVCSGIINFTVGSVGSAQNNKIMMMHGEDCDSEGIMTLTQHTSPTMMEGFDEAVPRVKSPLSSDICSSMVSSVYESSVKTVAADDMNDMNGINGMNGLDPDATSEWSAENDDTQTLTTTTTLGPEGEGEGKACGGNTSSSSEDMISIYDMPRRPKKSRRKRGLKASQPENASNPRASDVEGDFGNQGYADRSHDTDNFDDTIDGRNLDKENESKPWHSEQAGRTGEITGCSGTVEINGDAGRDSNSDTDVSDDLDVTPQYAFHHLNHHLTLYLMMTLFEPDEEFVCKIQGEFSQYIIDESYDGIFVMSSARFYVLKILSDDHTQDPSQWVQCVEIQPIPELRYIDLGLGGQSLRLEFVTDCSSYTIITRNRDRTAQFVDVLHTNLAKYAVSNGIASHVVVNEDVDQTTLDNLDKDVLSKGGSDQKLLLYCMGFIQRGVTDRFPVSFVIGTQHICLVRTCHQLPQRDGSVPGELRDRHTAHLPGVTDRFPVSFVIGSQHICLVRTCHQLPQRDGSVPGELRDRLPAHLPGADMPSVASVCVTDRFPVSFVIGTHHICLVRTCHQWPQPRLQAPLTVETVGRQFVVLERQLVNNVASVNVDESSLRKVSLELFNEKEGVSTHWNISLASRQTTVDFVQALSVPWEREFGVEMDVAYSDLSF